MTVVICYAYVVPEFPSMGTITWCGELDLTDDPESVADCIATGTEGYLQIGSVEDLCIYQFKTNNREVGYGFWLRHTFITYACESVISGHEQVISTDMALGVEWRSFGSDRLSQSVPFQLFIVVEIPPLLKSSLMDRQLHLLSCCPRKYRFGFSLYIALSVDMNECNVTD